MTHVTCRLTAKNRDQLRNPMLGNRVWATFTFIPLTNPAPISLRSSHLKLSERFGMRVCWRSSRAPKPPVHGPDDQSIQTSNCSTTPLDFSTSAVPLSPLLPPTLGASAGQRTPRAHDATALNYSLPRSASGDGRLPKTGSGIPTSKRPRPETDDSAGCHCGPRDPVRTSV